MAKRIGILAAVVALLVAADLLTKQVAVDELRGQSSVTVIDGFWDFRYAENRGIAFSLDRHLPATIRRPLVVGMGIVVLGLLIWLAIKGLTGHWLERTGYTLAIGGAIGNLSERLVRGFVVDFVDWHLGSFQWPIFNLADSFLVMGVLLLIGYQFFGWREPIIEGDKAETDTETDTPNDDALEDVA